MKLEQRQPALILVKCLASPLEGPRAHADKRPHTCQLIEHFQFHNPHSTCTSTCDKPRAGAHWGSSQSLELAQPSSQQSTVICTRSGTSRPMKVPEGPSDSLGMLEYLTRLVTLVSFAQLSKPVSVGQNRGGVYGE